MLEGRSLIGVECERKRMVYVVDDEPSVRMSLVFLLEANGWLPWPFAGGLDFLESLPVLEPGCVLLDIRMPQIDGLQVMANLMRRECDWPVIIITGHGDVTVAVQAMKLGAIEFIEKPFNEDLLFHAVERGFAKLDEAEARHVTRLAAEERMALLSPREREVLGELIAGRQNKAAAHSLGLSVRTVEMHRANLLAKLGVRNIQEASAILAPAGRSATA